MGTRLELGECLDVLKTLDASSVDAVCTVHGDSGILGLWKTSGIKLIKLILAGYGLALTMGLGMARYVSEVKSTTRTGYLTSGQRVKSHSDIKLTTFAECDHAAIQSIWKLSLLKSMSAVASQKSLISLRLTV